MICRFCGKEIPDDSRFCPECGEKLEKEVSGLKEEQKQPAPSTDKVKSVAGQALCPVCENVITDNNKLIDCSDCGKKLCETCATHFKESRKEKSRKVVLCQDCEEKHDWDWEFRQYAIKIGDEIYSVDTSTEDYIVLGLFEDDYEFLCPSCERFDKNVDVSEVYGIWPGEKEKGATALYKSDYFQCEDCGYAFLGATEHVDYLRNKERHEHTDRDGNVVDVSFSYPKISGSKDEIIRKYIHDGKKCWYMEEGKSRELVKQRLVLSWDFLCQFCLQGKDEYTFLDESCSDCMRGMCEIHTEGHTIGGDKCPECSDSGLCEFCPPEEYSIAEHECESCGKPICEEHVASEEGMIRKNRFCPDCA